MNPHTNLNNVFDFPDLPMLLPKSEALSVTTDFSVPPVQQGAQQFHPPRNLGPQLARRWSCGDSQHADEPPASYYHNLGVALHNHFQMSNQHYLSDFDCPPTVSPISSAHETGQLPQLSPYDHIGNQDPHMFSPHAYGNSMIPDNSYFENASRSISAPNVGNSTLNPSLMSSDNAQSCGGRRRFRTNFTELQSTFLEDSFKESHYPDHKAKKYMADFLKIPEDRITVWFQNRRAKWRRKEHRQRDRTRNESFSGGSNSFDFACFSAQHPDDGPNAKHPNSFGIPNQPMSLDQFPMNTEQDFPEFPSLQEHQ